MECRKLKKIVLCMVLLVLLALPARAAETTLRINAPDTLPAVGETFTVTVEIIGNPGLCAAQYTLAFDSQLVSCESAQVGEVLSGTLSATNPNASGGAIVAAATTTPATGDGSIGVFTFRVLKSGGASFTLKDGVFSDANGGEITTNVPAVSAGQTGQTQKPGQSQPDASQPEQTQPDAAEAPAQRFTDVPATHWAYSVVEQAAELGYITGMGDGTFAPDRELTRAEFVTMLWRMAGKPQATTAASFTDVPADAWYRDAVSWAAEQGYVKGTGDTTFAPNGKLTRQEAVTVLFRYSGGQSGMELMLTQVYDSQYTDSGSIASWAKSAVYWAIYNGVINGTSDTTVSPNGTATRAQIAAILVRYSG